jgi:hypothetical protein
MGVPPSLLVAAFDPKTARFVVVGQKISFADPRTAKAAGCIVATPPPPVVGSVTVAVCLPPDLPSPLVISKIAGTEHHPTSGVSALKEPAANSRPEVNAPKARRRA